MSTGIFNIRHGSAQPGGLKKRMVGHVSRNLSPNTTGHDVPEENLKQLITVLFEIATVTHF